MDRDIAVIGGGNWGTTVAKLAGENMQNKGKKSKVRMWVYEEMIGKRNLTNIINTDHENLKYLPGVKLPENIKAYTDIKEAVKEVEVIALVVPHEFLDGILQQMKDSIKDTAVLVVLTKGFFFNGEKMELISKNIKKKISKRVCTLMGANIAGDIAAGKFSECTLGYQDEDAKEKILEVFNTAKFKVSAVKDNGCIEVCSALKNVVSIGCGVVSGYNNGINTQAAVIRNGLLEIVKFCDRFIEAKSSSDMIPSIFFESCGVADLIVTCMAGRNYRYSKMAAEKKISLETVEKEEMNGQKLYGYSTAQGLMSFMKLNNVEKKYPVLYAIAVSATSDLSAERILKAIQEK